jgi:hypothetical protein
MKVFNKIILSCFFILIFASCKNMSWGGGYGSPKSTEPDTKHKHKHHQDSKHKKGPPAHAPAHGYHKKHKFKHYPSKEVYYSAEKKIWFWVEGEKWKFGASLPAGLTVDQKDAVELELDIDKPYTHYKDHHKKSHPEKGKGKSKGKGKGKGRYK